MVHSDFDLAAKARALGLSRTRFVHVFRDVVGVTPHRYVIELRTGHAARLLRGIGAPVTDICFAVHAVAAAPARQCGSSAG